MKKIAFLSLMLGVLLIVSCSNTGQAHNPEGDDNKVATEKSNDTNPEAKAQGDVTTQTIHLTKADFLEKVMDYETNPNEWKYKGELPAMIDFYADWCRPCRMAAPVLEDLAKEYAGKIIIYKIDTQVEQELAQVFGVQGIPAFLFIPMEGKPQMTSGIARTPEETKTMFKEIIDDVLL